LHDFLQNHTQASYGMKSAVSMCVPVTLDKSIHIYATVAISLHTCST
jgi:hypothetical protein